MTEMMSKKILFITWDGPQTSYMEGLFLPILSEVHKKANYSIHVIQFIWGTPERIAIIQKKASELDIKYSAQIIHKKPVAIVGNLWTVFLGIKFLKQYIEEHQIDIVMPRSTIPALMVNRLQKNFKLIFDADGLPLEERVDFSGLKKTSKQYLFLKEEETKMILRSDVVITRSIKAIQIHKQNTHLVESDKFSVVFNGRDASFFKPFKENLNDDLRVELGINITATVFVYCGSLGPQYGWEEMIEIVDQCHKKNNNTRFLIITGNLEFAYVHIPKELQSLCIIKKLAFQDVPRYLSIANIAFAIRQPSNSMQGVAPIKLGEYLLMGIPTIASAGIGDTETILATLPECFIYNHDDVLATQNTLNFIEKSNTFDKVKIREFGLQHFSIEKSAESYLSALRKLN